MSKAPPHAYMSKTQLLEDTLLYCCLQVAQGPNATPEFILETSPMLSCLSHSCSCDPGEAHWFTMLDFDGSVNSAISGVNGPFFTFPQEVTQYQNIRLLFSLNLKCVSTTF